MRPLVFVWPFGLLFWSVCLWCFWPEFRLIAKAGRDVRRDGAQDAGSCRVIVYGMWLASAIAMPIAAMSLLQFPAFLMTAAFAAGVALMIAGSLLRRHCFRMLGASFTGDVRVRPDQQIVTSGAYSLLRHPSYSAGVLMNLGIGLALGSWASTVVLAAAAFAVYAYRISVEERALLATIGEPYREFMRGRKRLIPYVY